jgi:hypothetical protein
MNTISGTDEDEAEDEDEDEDDIFPNIIFNLLNLLLI